MRGQLDEHRRREVLAVISRIHERMGFSYPPFRLDDFLRTHDSYRVFELDMPLGLDGRLVMTPDGERKTVHLRRQNPRPRVRFTLAHEIVHAELHFRRGQLNEGTACRTSEHYRDGRRSLLEREADFGAAALLMPLWMLDRQLPYRIRHDYPDHVVKDMAHQFLVSESAMRIQLKQYVAYLDELGPI